MAIFADGPAYQSNSITTSAKVVWSGTFTPLAGLTTTLRDITIANVGAVTVYLGGSSVAVTGLPLLPGEQVTIQGWAATADTTTRDIYGITASGTTTVNAGLASVASVV